MLDTIIKIGTVFDWITPVFSLFQDWQNGPSTGFNVPVGGGYSAYAIQDILSAGGIKIWGLRIINNTILFRTRKTQAAFAQYLLERNGISYQGGIGDTIQLKKSNAPKPASTGGLSRILDSINKVVDTL
jgi:hypothetical protein